MNVGRNECVAISTLLRSVTTRLKELRLYENDIDDEGVDALVGALTSSGLQYLDLSSNHSITARGCHSLSLLLESPNCNLVMLDLDGNRVGDEGARIFAISLASYLKLKDLDLCDNGITAEGWSYFARVLCDTSSINNTFLSNHTLGSFGMANPPSDIRSLLTLNSSSEDKKQVAIIKILQHHQHFDMRPFFEWDLKVLPIAINWFERARSVVNDDELGIGKHKLGAIYQFIRAMPEVFEPVPGAGEARVF